MEKFERYTIIIVDDFNTANYICSQKESKHRTLDFSIKNKSFPNILINVRNPQDIIDECNYDSKLPKAPASSDKDRTLLSIKKNKPKLDQNIKSEVFY